MNSESMTSKFRNFGIHAVALLICFSVLTPAHAQNRVPEQDFDKLVTAKTHSSPYPLAVCGQTARFCG